MNNPIDAGILEHAGNEITDKKAREQNVGGEIVCYIW